MPMKKFSVILLLLATAALSPAQNAAASGADKVGAEKRAQETSPKKAGPPLSPDKPKATAQGQPQANADKTRTPVAPSKEEEDRGKLNETPDQHEGLQLWLIVLVLLVLVLLLQLIILLRPLFSSAQTASGDSGSGSDPSSDGFSSLDRNTLQVVRNLAKDIQEKKLPDITRAIGDQAKEITRQLGELKYSEEAFKKLKEEREELIQELRNLRLAAKPLEDRNLELEADNSSLRSIVEDNRVELDESNAERLRQRGEIERLTADLEGLEHKYGDVTRLLSVTEQKLASANVHLEDARRSADTAGLQLEASFALMAPRFLSDPESVALMRKLHLASLSGSAVAAAAWSTLTAFASAEADPAARDFQLHVLKRLGSVLVSYWKEQPGSSPKDRHERLSHWARCLNEHAQGRYNLFVPAIGSPVDRTKMSTLTSATVVQEVLCWQVRNPAGANYSLAEVA